MATREQKVEPFKSGQNSAAKGEPAGPVKVKSNMSKTKNAGNGDALHAMLASRTPILPSDNHVYTHTTRVEPAGAHYSPRGEFGKVAETGKSSGVYDYGSAPDKKGDNPLGRALNKVGTQSGGKKRA